MEAVTFSESNTVFAKDQAEYRRLPAHRVTGDPQGRLVFCWRLTWRERLRLLLTGKLWHQCLSFNHTLQPQLLTVDKPEMQARGGVQ